MTDLSNLPRFLLEADFEVINDFLGETLLVPSDKVPDGELREFISKLANKIIKSRDTSCKRRCPFRRKK